MTALRTQLASQLARPRLVLDSVRDIAPRPGASPAAEGGGRTRLLPLAWLATIGLFGLLMGRSVGGFLHALERALQDGWRLVALGALLEVGSLAGYVALLHRLLGGFSAGIRAKDSYDITMAGTAATRLLPTAGLGGAAVTVWALRARGLRSGEITERLLAFLLILYAVYVWALLVFGAAVGLGLVTVSAGSGLGLLAVGLAVVLTVAVLTLLLAPSLTVGVLGRLASGSGRLAPQVQRAVDHVPALRAALVRAGRELRRPHPALLGALAWWALDIGVLLAMLHAFDTPLPIPVVVLAYFLGTMCNLLPLPGSLSGGLAGMLIAFGAPAGGALAAVLAYRTIAVWLPAASGVASLFSLRATVACWRAEGAVIRTPAHLPAV
ncbi:MAG: hypothetical protein QOK19_174 [Solirubrobacteraceae bacterium]|nr:hypothetical protein [Solirubrobacterales bacterium]MEA2214613.1 hypothetical protein [Solirubrobacteraceae bacterium]